MGSINNTSIANQYSLKWHTTATNEGVETHIHYRKGDEVITKHFYVKVHLKDRDIQVIDLDKTAHTEFIRTVDELILQSLSRMGVDVKSALYQKNITTSKVHRTTSVSYGGDLKEVNVLKEFDAVSDIFNNRILGENRSVPKTAKQVGNTFKEVKPGMFPVVETIVRIYKTPPGA